MLPRQYLVMRISVSSRHRPASTAWPQRSTYRVRRSFTRQSYIIIIIMQQQHDRFPPVVLPDQYNLAARTSRRGTSVIYFRLRELLGRPILTFHLAIKNKRIIITYRMGYVIIIILYYPTLHLPGNIKIYSKLISVKNDSKFE